MLGGFISLVVFVTAIINLTTAQAKRKEPETLKTSSSRFWGDFLPQPRTHHSIQKSSCQP